MTLSCSGLKWILREADEKTVNFIMGRYDYSDLMARILASRKIAVEKIPEFITPSLQKNLPDPETLTDMKKAACRIIQAIKDNDIVGIMGDYDVDGATSTSIIKLFLEELGIKVLTFIPEREDGYGPNAAEMKRFQKEGVKLVLTVDCGTTSFDPISKGKELGLDIIVIDHHEPDLHLPEAYAVVNPKRLDEDITHPCRFMAACGVCFLFVVEVNRLLKEQGFYKDKKAPDLRRYLDLVALGTICDVVKLEGVNRLYVKKGLQQMERRENIGIASLIDTFDITPPLSSYHLGYIFGPLLNAGGRVGKSSLAMNLLSSKDTVSAEQVIEHLKEHNAERKNLEAFSMNEALNQAEEQLKENPSFLLLAQKGWHQGVIGILAGRLKERYSLPVFVVSIDEGECKGSSRSIAGVDIGETIMTALERGILTRGGGHPMAAGFSLKEEKLPEFRTFLNDYLQKFEKAPSVTELVYDNILNVKGATLSLVKELECLEPFGEGNPEPYFILKNVTIKNACVLKNGHIRCGLIGNNGGYLPAIAFRAEGTPLGKNLMENKSNFLLDIAGHLKKNVWKGTETIQFLIKDAKISE
ncbi:MAG: single-stranded-DNA-specific exonuclease RecJ [Alphaproteobacteria bacterium]|nr:single-stranded-DNA-specific exonuclease RecJ [Alphaproteobacteria bacterium]